MLLVCVNAILATPGFTTSCQTLFHRWSFHDALLLLPSTGKTMCHDGMRMTVNTMSDESMNTGCCAELELAMQNTDRVVYLSCLAGLLINC